MIIKEEDFYELYQWDDCGIIKDENFKYNGWKVKSKTDDDCNNDYQTCDWVMTLKSPDGTKYIFEDSHSLMIGWPEGDIEFEKVIK